MKLFKAALITAGLLLCWVVNGYADRLYTWTDAKGVTHITQDPPPDTAKVVDTIDYSPQPNQPAHRSTASDRPISGRKIWVRGAGNPGVALVRASHLETMEMTLSTAGPPICRR